MPHKDSEADDPLELIGVVLPADVESTRDMAYVFAEEFARMGYDRSRLFSLFKNPFYGGAHGAYRALGEPAIGAIIDECMAAWGGVSYAIADVGPCAGDGKIENPKSKIQNEER